MILNYSLPKTDMQNNWLKYIPRIQFPRRCSIKAMIKTLPIIWLKWVKCFERFPLQQWCNVWFDRQIPKQDESFTSQASLLQPHSSGLHITPVVQKPRNWKAGAEVTLQQLDWSPWLESNESFILQADYFLTGFEKLVLQFMIHREAFHFFSPAEEKVGMHQI